MIEAFLIVGWLLTALGFLGHCASLARQNGVREKEWALERGALLQRIQAPETAVQGFSERPKRKRMVPVPVDDDKAYREALERKMNGNAD